MSTRLGRALVFVGAICIALSAWAQPKDIDRKADHEALRALRGKLAAAFEKQDVPAMRACFAKDFVFTTVTQSALTSEDQVQQFLNKMFRGEGAVVTAMKSEAQADILTRFLSDNVGVCYGTARDTYTLKSGEVVPMDLRWSATVVKESGEWKVAVAHVGTDFMDNPVLARTMKAGRTLAIVAVVAGLIIGGAVGWIIGRRRKPVAA